MSRPPVFILGAVLLAAMWLGPLPGLASSRFSAHMTLHMGVVAIAAPLVALGLAGGRWDPARARPGWFNPMAASAFELVAVWAWHTPVLHAAARHRADALALEQATFLIAGLWLWLAAFGGGDRGDRAWAGVAGLLFTSIHMTLLGALLVLSPRALYVASGHSATSAWDQHLGGGIMLLVGGVSYLAGGLWLAREGLRSPEAQAARRAG